jgi:hypothetical protein
MKLWPKESGAKPVFLKLGRPINSLAVLPDGRLASGDIGGSIELWPVKGTGESVFLTHGARSNL